MMKLNQFARITADPATQYRELAAIGLPADPAADFFATIQATYAKLFPVATSPQAIADAQAAIAVDDYDTLATWLQTPQPTMTRREFYNIGLQLLGFEAFTDFQLTAPLTFMAQTKLPVVAQDLIHTADFLQAIYLLLTTRTKHLVTLLDDLANRGFFKDYHRGYLFFNGKSQNVFDARQLVRECVWIESDLDTDGDGQRDMLEATIFRPKETDAGIKMPALFTANPYFHGTNDVEAVTHDPDPKLAVKTESHTKADVTYHPEPQPDLPHRPITGVGKAEVYADENGIYSLNDYFLGRGFVTVYSAGVGTRGSDGVRSTGGVSEIASAVAVIEWLTGARRAFTTRTGTTETKAWWCNGKVAMTGKSYLGTLAIAAATSGVAGLKTVISEAAISSWYDYYRENGLVVAPGGYQGEDADVLAVDTFSRQKAAGDMLKLRGKWSQTLDAIGQAQDRTTGDYNAWWDERNYRNNLKNIRCDVVSVHGLNDWNVKPANVIRFWNGLRDLPIQKKLFLHQGQHVYLNNVLSLDFTDMMNLWLSYELLDVENDAPAQLPNVTVQDNVEPETWHTYADFGHSAHAHKTRQYDLLGDFTGERASFADNATGTFKARHQTSDLFEAEIIKPASLYRDARLWLTQAPASDTRVLEGVPHVHLRLWIDAPTGILSVRLVDLGPAKRFGTVADVIDGAGYQLGYDYKTDKIVEFKPAAETASKLITFGHVNLQNPKNAYEIQQITPGEAFTVDFDLQPTHYVLPAERQLALVIHGADMAQTQRPTAVVNYHIDRASSSISLPFRVNENG